jgi:hypothetical protein
VTLHLLQQLVDLLAGAQRDRAVSLAPEVFDHFQRVAADRSGRSEDGNPFGQRVDDTLALGVWPVRT